MCVDSDRRTGPLDAAIVEPDNVFVEQRTILIRQQIRWPREWRLHSVRMLLALRVPLKVGTETIPQDISYRRRITFNVSIHHFTQFKANIDGFWRCHVEWPVDVRRDIFMLRKLKSVLSLRDSERNWLTEMQKCMPSRNTNMVRELNRNQNIWSDGTYRRLNDYNYVCFGFVTDVYVMLFMHWTVHVSKRQIKQYEILRHSLLTSALCASDRYF